MANASAYTLVLCRSQRVRRAFTSPRAMLPNRWRSAIGTVFSAIYAPPLPHEDGSGPPQVTPPHGSAPGAERYLGCAMALFRLGPVARVDPVPYHQRHIFGGGVGWVSKPKHRTRMLCGRCWRVTSTGTRCWCGAIGIGMPGMPRACWGRGTSPRTRYRM